jgi:hypothetical protein
VGADSRVDGEVAIQVAVVRTPLLPCPLFVPPTGLNDPVSFSAHYSSQSDPEPEIGRPSPRATALAYSYIWGWAVAVFYGPGTGRMRKEGRRPRSPSRASLKDSPGEIRSRFFIAARNNEPARRSRINSIFIFPHAPSQAPPPPPRRPDVATAAGTRRAQ